ncbi:MAG: hypothetical protein ACI8RD_014056 [Bacillariaceae sp.]|jgi:hypothetical protein
MMSSSLPKSNATATEIETVHCKSTTTMTTSSSSSRSRLIFLYRITTAVCLWMILWILVLPGSWMFGRTKLHNDVIEPYLMDRMRHHISSLETITKYKGHTAVHFTHILPACVWSAAIPFQLHREFRKNYKQIHRVIGYVFFGISFVMALGVGIILRRGLYFENSFSDLPQPSIPSYYYSIVLAIVGYFCYEDVVYHANNKKNKKKFYSRASTVCVVILLILVGGTMSYHREYRYLSTAPIIMIVTAYFVATAMYALKLAAIDRKFHDHQRWIIRHVASGVWVMIQRILIIILFAPIHRPPVSREVQRDVFAQSSILVSKKVII